MPASVFYIGLAQKRARYALHYVRNGAFFKESLLTAAGKYFSSQTRPDRFLETCQVLVVYNPFMLPDLQMRDLLRLRKPHPCGSYEWTVTRLGADIGLECCGCKHRVLLTRRELAKRMKTNLSQQERENSKQETP